MQVSAIFRRGVILPLDEEAEGRLKANDVEETISVRYLEIEDRIFEVLWYTGVFQRINARTNALIDDYEECFVEADLMPEVLKAIAETLTKRTFSSSVMNFLTSLSSIATEAASSGRPLFFVL